ncbi:hypothetical protein K7I12_16960 [Halomonas sp. IOP_31]|nr:hypothetical protein [Halomonas sp. IOP_31]
MLTADIGENVVGTTGDDSFSAIQAATGAATLNVGDQIDGAAGFDTLNLITDSGELPTGVTVEDVERVNLNLGADSEIVTTSDFGDALEQLWLTGSHAATVDVAADTTLGFSGKAAQAVTTANVAGGTFNLAVANPSNSVLVNAAAAAGAAELTTVNVSGEMDDGDVYLGDTDNTITTLNLALSGDADVDAKGGNAITGMGNLETVDAFDSTGKLMIDVDGNTGVDVTGGSGDDYIILGSTFDVDNEIDGGEGNDTLQVELGTVNTQGYLALNAVENVEEVYFNTGATLDVAKVDSVSTFGFEAGGTVTNVTDETSLIARDDGTLNVEHADSDAEGAAGTVNLELDDQAAVTVDAATGGDAFGFESLVVTGNGAVIFDNNNAAADVNAATSIDLSGLALLDGDDEIDDQNDTSTITLNGSVAESVTLSGGIDSVDASGSTYENMDTITGFQLEDGDDLALADNLNLGARSDTTLSEFEVADGSTLDQAFVNAIAASNTDTSAKFFQFEDNTYVVDDAGTTGQLDDTDFAVKLVGSYDLSQADGTIAVA